MKRYFSLVIALVILTVAHMAFATPADDRYETMRFGAGSASNTPAFTYQDMSTSGETPSATIQTMFDSMSTVGSALNTGNTRDAARGLLDRGCQSMVASMMTNEMMKSFTPSAAKLDLLPVDFAGFVDGKTEQMKQSLLGMACLGIRGETPAGFDLGDMGRNELLPLLLTTGQAAAHNSGLPFIKGLEIETGIEDGEYYGSVTTVQPLWKDINNTHHVFSQLSWYRTNDDKYADTLNVGIAYRHLNEAEDLLLGANLFFDHAYERNHNRMSIGVDARTSLLGVSANRYIPLSDWKSIDALYEERATAGWDLEMRGQVPSLPSWTGTVKGYTWDGHGGESDTYGYNAGVEYSPVPAVAIRAAVQDETHEKPSLEMALRFNWRFDQPADMQFRERLSLTPVSDLVYEKVHRENRIRVSQRLKESAFLTVTDNIGANTALTVNGTVSVSSGQTLTIPVTVTVANTPGAIMRLRFSDGAVLTLGQGTQVQIQGTEITLVIGVAQYVSGGVTRTVNVPGGTIQLLGTDIDLTSDGVTSSVRVRDGSVRVTGTATGTATLAIGQMAEANSGVITTLPPNSPAYMAHTDDISVKVERAAPPLEISKAAPYPDTIPYIVQDATSVGSTVLIAQNFSKNVIVSGGPPRLSITINGTPRLATYSSGSGSMTLVFAYVLQASDLGANGITVRSIDNNGASIYGDDGKTAVTTFADSPVALSGPVTGGDVTPPAGYSVAFTTDPIRAANQTAASFTIASAEIGTTYSYSITSTGGGTAVTGSGPVMSSTQSVSGINVSGLGDGTLTLSVTLTDSSLNTGGVAADTVNKDANAPTGYAVAFTTDPLTSANANAAAFTISAAEVGSTYNYSISSSNGGTAVTGSGTIATATQSVSGINLSALPDGTLTVSVTLTDTGSNIGTAVTDTVIKDAAAPSGYTVAFTTDPVTSTNAAAAAFTISSAEVGTTYNYSITSSGGGTAVTGSGTVATATQAVTGINVAGLGDGTLTVSVTLTDGGANTGAAATDTVTKDSAAPSGYTVAFTTDPLTSANANAAAFTISAAEVGATYNYSITSSGGGTAVTGSGTIATATQAVTGLNLTGLGDGTVTVSLTLTDTGSNTGAAVTDTVIKDASVPSGYTVAFTTDPLTSANANAAAFTISAAEVGTTYNYSITSSGGGTAVTGSGTIATATQAVTGLNLTGLGDGTVTVSLTLTDSGANTGAAVTDTVIKDASAPSGYTVAFTTDPLTAANSTAAAFTISSAEVGTTYNYSITSSGGGTAVTGSGTVATATQAVSGLNLTGLGDGTVTVSVTLTDSGSNVGAAVTDTVAKDATAPSGYTATFTTDPVNSANQTAAAFSILGAEVGTTYNYSITSSGGGTAVTGSGSVATATQPVTGINVSGLNDGTLTVSVVLTDASGNAGTAVTDTAVKNLSAPSAYTVLFTTDPVNAGNQTAAAFTMSSAEVGATYNYSITSSGGGTAVTGSGTVATATQAVTGINVSGLTDGTLTVSLTLTSGGNTGPAVTDTVTKDALTPSGYTAAFTTDPVNSGNVNAAAFSIASAEVGTTYNYSITSSGGGTAVTGSGTVATATQSVTGLNLSGLNDGTLTVSVTLTDSAGNTGAAATDTVLKNTAAPTGYTVAFTTDPVNAANANAGAFTISLAEVGATYNYSITSSGGGTAVTGSGSVATATQSVTGLNLTGLTDGTLTVSVTLTNTSGNTGTAVTDTVVKDAATPTGYTAAFTTDPVNAANATAAAFSISSAEVGTTYNYSITSSGGGTAVAGSGTVATATQPVTGINLSGLNDGTLTVSVTLTDAGANTGAAATDTVVKDAAAPAGYTAVFTIDPINSGNASAAAFTISSAEVGAAYNYSITSSGGGTAVTGSGTIATATQAITGLNVSGLTDGTLTVSVTLTDTSGNTGAAATDTVVKDAAAPAGYTAVFTTDPVNAANANAGAFTISSAEVGTTYNYSITSSGGGTAVTGSGTVATATQPVTGLNLTGLGDGTLTVSVTLTDAGGNTGTAATDTVVKDATTPAGYAVVFTTDPVNSGNVSAAAFTLSSAEVGAAYSYSITSSGGGTAVTGSGTVATASQSFTGLNLTGLNDGTLTVSLTLTDTAGNAGAAATDTVVKDVSSPSGYSAAFNSASINSTNASSAGFTISSAEIGSTYSYSITSSGGGTAVTGSGTVASASEVISGLNLTGLNDGTLTVTVILTDPSGNAGTSVTNTVVKDAVAPTIVSVTPPADGTYGP